MNSKKSNSRIIKEITETINGLYTHQIISMKDFDKFKKTVGMKKVLLEKGFLASKVKS
jgi:hypothetical protein